MPQIAQLTKYDSFRDISSSTGTVRATIVAAGLLTIGDLAVHWYAGKDPIVSSARKAQRHYGPRMQHGTRIDVPVSNELVAWTQGIRADYRRRSQIGRGLAAIEQGIGYIHREVTATTVVRDPEYGQVEFRGRPVPRALHVPSEEVLLAFDPQGKNTEARLYIGEQATEMYNVLVEAGMSTTQTRVPTGLVALISEAPQTPNLIREMPKQIKDELQTLYSF